MSKKMLFNKIIKNNARAERTAFTARYDKDGLTYLKNKIRDNEALEFIDFITLADIYGIHYSVTMSINKDAMYHCISLDSNDGIMMDYVHFIEQHMIDSQGCLNLNYQELYELFKSLGGCIDIKIR